MAAASVARAAEASVADNDPAIIRLRGVTKMYGAGATAFRALKGIDLDFAAGDFVAVMGP